jgi:3-hydroxyisobutyrate dehydrogenase-like beta-hydroxyacid dehydrogenase
MGLGMALNLQKHLQTQGGPPLRYSNRSLAKGQPLKDAGAIPEKDFEALVQGCDIIFTMVSVATDIAFIDADFCRFQTMRFSMTYYQKP